MKTNIKDIVDELKKVASGELDEVDLSMKCSPNEAAEYIMNILKMEQLGQLETNGWQYDFWQHYKSQDGKYFCLYGGGWYGELGFGSRSEDEIRDNGLLGE